jgi:hypothetical protein
MSKKILLASVVLAALVPASVFTQSGGAAAGAVGGAVASGIADQQQPQFRQYITTQSVPSYGYREEVRVGAVLPESGVVYHEVPAEYQLKGHR